VDFDRAVLNTPIRVYAGAARAQHGRRSVNSPFYVFLEGNDDGFETNQGHDRRSARLIEGFLAGVEEGFIVAPLTQASTERVGQSWSAASPGDVLRSAFGREPEMSVIVRVYC
jgi:hypothetical protein